MKFTILSHAGLLVEHAGKRLVCDPWLIGSCYWRSWWNFPEPDAALLQSLAPDFIYLTHLHWDHFHGPSLQKFFHPSTRILVPRVPTRRMLDDLRWLGFENVTEIRHGTRFVLGDDFELHSYQFGLSVDSAAVIRGGDHTLFNCNDCKFFGLPLQQILVRHPQIDFILRSHSSASPVPFCVENHEQLLPPDDGSYDSADQFARCALFTQARYAVPFASNHCFLHADTRRFNGTATTPETARRRFNQIAAQTGQKAECVVMPPGSAWSAESGFEVVPFDFSRREDYVKEMLGRHAGQLAERDQLEAQAQADFDAFREYFDDFLGSVPWFLRRRLAPITFRVCESDRVHVWRVNPWQRRVEVLAVPMNSEAAFEVQAAVLNDCVKQRMFSVWTASKRLRIHLPSAAALSQTNLWFTLLDLYEVDQLPLLRNFSLRSLGVRVRRWREPVELVSILLRRLFLRQRFSVSRIYPLEDV